MSDDDKAEVKVLLDTARICIAKVYKILYHYEKEKNDFLKSLDKKGGEQK